MSNQNQPQQVGQKIGNANMPQLNPLGLILFLCLSFCSETVNAYPKPTPPQLQTQNNTPDTKRAAAEKAEQEAKKLDVKKTPITQVIAKWEEALKYWRLAGERKKEATTLDRIARLYFIRGEYPKALEYAQKAQPICEALSDRKCEEAVMVSLTLIYENMGKYQKVIDNAQQLASLSPESIDLRSITLTTIGRIYLQKLGETKKGIDYYKQALAFWKEKGNVIKQAEKLEDIAFVYSTLGEINKTLEILKQANNLEPEFKRNGSSSNGVIYLSLSSKICADKLASLKKPPKLEQPKNLPW